jgi:hypothetical protein
MSLVTLKQRLLNLQQFIGLRPDTAAAGADEVVPALAGPRGGLVIEGAGEGNTVLTKDFLKGIATGSVTGFEFLTLGYAPGTIGTTRVDLLSQTPAASYQFPQESLQMSVVSAGADDVGVVGFSGTATGGSSTTLVDTTKDFTAGTPVEPGDVICVAAGRLRLRGTVRTVTPTTLTVFAFDGAVFNPTGLPYQILDTSAGGTGIQAVEIDYLDSNWQMGQEILVLNGTTHVDTVETDIYRINGMSTVAVGTCGGGASGLITLVDSGSHTTIYDTILANENTAQQAIGTVPHTDYFGNEFTAAYITSWHVAASKSVGTIPVTFWLRATVVEGAFAPGVCQNFDIITVQDGFARVLFEIPRKIPARSDVRISVQNATLTGVTASGRAAGWLEYASS